ncbi:P protein [Amyelois transitella]|uniref:P protein n=1 Tax=Amyelois transitella TaxID=680683 RepID=UPI00067CD9DF|nr:P protein [Amyelois transitella]
MSFWASLKDRVTSKKQPDDAWKRSQYSLVSSDDLNANTLKVWLELPEEVKNDPSLAPFKQQYEKEHGKPANKKNTSRKRLPSVNSAPSLNENAIQTDVIAREITNDEQKHNNAKENAPNDNVTKGSNKTSKKWAEARYYVKMSVLVACWLFFTSVFMMYNEKHNIVRNTSIKQGENKDYILDNIPKLEDEMIKIKVQLNGPFLTVQEQSKLNSSEMKIRNKLHVWFVRLKSDTLNSTTIANTTEDITEAWTIALLDEEQIDFNEGELRSHTFELRNVVSNYALRMSTNSQKLTPFTMSYTISPIDANTGVIYAIILLIGLYILIIFEVINKTMAAITAATLSLAILTMLGERPTLSELVSWLDHETLLLLFSMMVLVAIMAETGIFDFLAVFTFEVTKGRLWPLIYLLCFITAIVSTVLDNVTTVLLMSPVTIRLCEVMGLDPVPILMFMAIYSNVGGTATPVGDPPCVIVVSNKDVIRSGINFTNFTAHMALGVGLVLIQTSLQIRYMFRDTNKLRLTDPRDIQEIRRQISIWRRAADSLPHLSKEVNIVRERLEKNITKLNSKLEVLVKERNKRACPKDTFQEMLVELKQKYKLRDKVLLIKASIAILFVVTVFFLHSAPMHNRMSLSWTALLGAILLLILADREDLEPILHRVEWSTLLFFAAFFVFMEALSKLGLITIIGRLIEQLILKVDEGARLAVAIVLTLWVSGIISICIDNIPLTTMMVRVVVTIVSNTTLNLPMGPMIWALLFGACLGGNGTLIAASANVVCAGVAEQHGYKFTFMRFFKVGFPIAMGHLVISTVYLLVCHCVFTWH